MGRGRDRWKEILISIYSYKTQATLPLTEKREETPEEKKQARQFGF